MKQPATGKGSAQKTKSVYTEHRDICGRFEESDLLLKRFRNDLKTLKTRLDALNAADSKDWDAIIKCKDEILDAKNQIKKLGDENDEMEYYKSASPILFKYYSTYENSDDPKAVEVTQMAPAKKSILHFLNNKKHQTEEESKDQRGTLYEMYMQLVNKDYVRQYPDEAVEKCPHCGFLGRHVIVNEGIAHCPKCMSADRILMEVEKPSYKEPPSEVTYFQYRRTNHFEEWLSQVQSKEYTDIPSEVIDRIIIELNKQKINNMATLTPIKIRQILRKLRLNKYYEHVSYIMHKMSGLPPPRLGEDVEEKLRHMFDAVQGPFLRHAPKGRTNFLSYSYCLHKFLQILDKPEFLCLFPLAKCREKIWSCEQTWSKICKDLGWQFIPSL
jgi:hypothetical protein